MHAVRAMSATFADAVLVGALGAPNALIVKLALITARPAFEQYASRLLTHLRP